MIELKIPPYPLFNLFRFFFHPIPAPRKTGRRRHGCRQGAFWATEMKEQKASNEQSSRFSQNSATYKRRRQHTEIETRYRTPREKIPVSEQEASKPETEKHYSLNTLIKPKKKKKK